MKLYDQYYNPTRGCSQPDIDRAYVLLERTGFALDTAYLSYQESVASEDERASLERLTGHYKQIGNSTAECDGIWSSPKRLIELLHGELRLPTSPICKKGEVRFGETKVDGTALAYLAAANPEYREFINEILELKTIRSSIKYLRKLPNYVDPTDGLVHPVYGPASDKDDSVGAKSGRTVAKNPELQQIPSNEEKDHYLIRKGFVAPKGYVLTVRDYAAMEAVLQHSLCAALFDDWSLEDANSPTFHAENARLVYGVNLGWSHNGKRIQDYDISDFKKDPFLQNLRRDTKTVFYGLQYRKGIRGFAYTLLDATGKPIGERLARDIVTGFLNVRTGLAKFHEWVDDYLRLVCKRPGFMAGIGGFSGRWRNCDDLLAQYRSTGKEDWMFRKAGRQCANHPLQEGGSIIKGTALVLMQRRFSGLDAHVQMDIHDELVVRNRERDQRLVDEIMKETMEETYELPCGVKLKTAGATGANWYEAK